MQNKIKRHDILGLSVVGHIKIEDADTGEVFVSKRNAINPEVVSIALANLMADTQTTDGLPSSIMELALGGGGVDVSINGSLTYKSTNTTGIGRSLYNETYSKVVNTKVGDVGYADNNIVVTHIPNTLYTDLVINCTLDYSEPSGQEATANGNKNYTRDTWTYVFDEIGLRTQSGELLTHVIFHPVNKAADRKIRIIYTVRLTVG